MQHTTFLSKQLFRWLLIIFLAADTSYSFLQHMAMPLDGDMAGGIVPDVHVQRVLEDPFAVSVLTEDASYANPNRFFGHWTFLHYFRNAPFVLQLFADPISSIYLSCALAKTLVQVLLLFLLAAYSSGTTNVRRTKFLLSAALISPLFQANGFCGCMGIIDPSITYTFFYALPLALTLLFYLPVFLQLHHNKSAPGKFAIALLVLLSVFSSLNGPLVPPVLIIVAVLYCGQKMYARLRGEKIRLDYSIALFCFAAVAAAYSLYVGSNNTLMETDSIDILTRYKKLPAGLWNIFSNKLAWPLLLLMTGANLFAVRKYFYTEEGKKIFRFAGWIALGAVVYLLLLPLGGYRSYRPEIIRHDTLLPVTLGMILVFGRSTVFVLRSLNKKWYAATTLAFVLIFMAADAPEFDKNAEERKSLAAIAASAEPVVKIECNCTIMAWYKITTPDDSRLNGQLLHYWGVTDAQRLYYQP